MVGTRRITKGQSNIINIQQGKGQNDKIRRRQSQKQQGSELGS